MVQHLKVLMPKPLLYISLAASEVVVHHEHLMPIQHQLVYQVGSNKASSSSDQDSLPVLVGPKLYIRIGGGWGKPRLQHGQLGLQHPDYTINFLHKTKSTILLYLLLCIIQLQLLQSTCNIPSFVLHNNLIADIFLVSKLRAD